MSDIGIKVENLSKLYQLGEVGTGTLSKDINRWWARVRGKDDPYTKVGQVNDRTKKLESDFVWALKDINFEVKQGEVLGIIGKNGAGKSTLLKILSKITSPTTGKIYTKGRIASLLEVGTGFHPEMTGRENIYLNGAILGMRKWEIDKKFDEIVDFAGVEAYVDTPVKRYSSGMYVRLAFAVAAFLEPEILIVDEVLAVGDADFQKKCLGRMKDVSVNDGRTVLFVSHNMDAVRDLTESGIVLKNGEMGFNGTSEDAVNYYLSNTKSFNSGLIYDPSNWTEVKLPHLLHEIKIERIQLLDVENALVREGNALKFKVSIKEMGVSNYQNLSFGLRILTENDFVVGTWFTKPNTSIFKNEFKEIDLQINQLNLAPGKYYFTLWIGVGNYLEYGKDFYSVDKVLFIEIIPSNNSSILPIWNNKSWGNVIFKDLEIVNP